MKKLLTGAALIALTLGMTGAASAFFKADGIRDSSSAVSTLSQSIKAKVTNTNTFGATNVVTSSSNAGRNVVSSADDMSDVEVGAGGASSATLADNSANSASDEFDVETGGPDDTHMNVEDDSSSTSVSTDELDKKIDSVNTTGVDNGVDATSNTGENVASSGDSATGVKITSGLSDSAAGLTQAFNLISEKVKRVVKFK